MGNKNSIKRTHPADAANIYVRNLLCEISERLGGFSKDDLKKTLKFFDHKCPYTGQTITKKNYALDHIEPHNRACCGLHIYGNVIPCYKKANARKSDKGFEDFINSIEEITEEEKQSRIKKLKDFISESNYHNIKESIGNELKDLIEIEIGRASCRERVYVLV